MQDTKEVEALDTLLALAEAYATDLLVGREATVALRDAREAYATLRTALGVSEA